MALINSEQNLALWSVLLLGAAHGLWLEKTRWGAKVSGVVITILTTFILSNFRIIPNHAFTYDVVWDYLVPLAIPLFLFRTDLLRIWQESGSTLIAYLVGTLGTVVGTVVAYHLISLGEVGWQLAGILCASYIGGSINFAATAETLGLRSGDLLSAGAAADNLVMAAYFLFLFSLPSLKWIKRIFPTHNSVQQTSRETDEILNFQEQKELQIIDISLSLAISGMVCTISYGLAAWLNAPQAGILVTTIIMVILATIFPHDLQKLVSAEQIGMLLMRIFFATIGASANIEVVIRVAPSLFIFAAIILVIHLVVLLSIGRFLHLELAELAIASNANLGGPSTAAAMAATKKWNKLVTPAILCGTLGYGIATFIGVGLAKFLR